MQKKSNGGVTPPSGVGGLELGLCVVSGGTRGIGRAIVEKFASEGFNIAVSARNQAHLLDLQIFIQSNYDVKCHIFQADLSIKSQVEGFVKFIINLQLPIKVLINNVGQYAFGSIHEAPEGILEKQIETNLYSAFYLTKGLIEDMKISQKGHIFNICSIASQEAYPNGGIYSVSKFALLGFSKNLSLEMEPYNINVTAILPGAVLTDSWDGADTQNINFIQPIEIADVIWDNYKSSPTPRGGASTIIVK